MRKTHAMLIAAGLGLAAACTPKTSAPPEAAPAEAAVVEEAAAPLTVNVLDCGTISVSDMDAFSSAGDYAGQADTLTDTCYVVNHPNGRLLWDLGLPTALAGAEPQTQQIFTVSMAQTITQQLAALGLTPADIDFVAISHNHFDHVGQADQVQGATWIVQEDEYNAMFPPADAELQPPADMAAMWAQFQPMATQKIRGDHDVFGDGTVKIIEMPGHTPGHSVLQLMMPETGPVLLTGDLYHRAESRNLKRVPRFNWNEPATLASMEAFETLAADLGAKVIIQHEPADIEPLGGVIR